MSRPPLLNGATLKFLRALARAQINSCGVPPGGTSAEFTNTLGFRAITPGGYPAIWVQDFTMNFSSGFISRAQGVRHLQLFMQSQNGTQPKNLGAGVIVPPHAIPDHINLDGSPVYFPGTYDPLAHQNGDWGRRPPVNNHYDVVWLAHMLAASGDAAALLRRQVNGRSIYERLQLAFDAPEVDPATGLVQTTAETRAVGFIFCDSIYMTGRLLTASLLRHRAAEQLSSLARKLGQEKDAAHYSALARRVARHIFPVFGDQGRHGGWLAASTGVSSQPDVWGSIHTLYRGLGPPKARSRLLHTLVNALQTPGEIEFQGALRHIPLSFDASPSSPWERTLTPKNRYQNGAYWHTPVGWLLTVLRDPFPQQAQAICDRWLEHLRAQNGRAWECIGWNDTANQNPHFAPSIALPLGVLQPPAKKTTKAKVSK